MLTCLKLWVVSCLSLMLFCCAPAFAGTVINPNVKLYLPPAPPNVQPVTPTTIVHHVSGHYTNTTITRTIVRRHSRDTPKVLILSPPLYFDAPSKPIPRPGINHSSIRV